MAPTTSRVARGARHGGRTAAQNDSRVRQCRQVGAARITSLRVEAIRVYPTYLFFSVWIKSSLRLGVDQITDEHISQIEHDPGYLHAVWDHYQYNQGNLSLALMLITAIQDEATRSVFANHFKQHHVPLSRRELMTPLIFS